MRGLFIGWISNGTRQKETCAKLKMIWKSGSKNELVNFQESTKYCSLKWSSMCKLRPEGCNYYGSLSRRRRKSVVGSLANYTIEWGNILVRLSWASKRRKHSVQVRPRQTIGFDSKLLPII